MELVFAMVLLHGFSISCSFCLSCPVLSCLVLRQRDRQPGSDTDRQTYIQTARQTDKQTDRETERQRDRQTENQSKIHRTGCCKTQQQMQQPAAGLRTAQQKPLQKRNYVACLHLAYISNHGLLRRISGAFNWLELFKQFLGDRGPESFQTIRKKPQNL